MPRCHAQPGARGLGQPRWTLTVQTSHHPGKPLWNLRISRPLGRRHTGRIPWTRRSAHGLTGSCYWLGQQSPSGRNTASSHGKLQRGFFNLVHRLAWIEGKLMAYPVDFMAKDFGKIDSLIKCFRVIHSELQPFVGAPVTVKTRQSKSRTPPVSSVGSAPTPTSSFIPGTLLPLDIPLAPPTSTPVTMPRPM